MTLELPAEIAAVNIKFLALTDSGGYWEEPTWDEVDYGEWLTYPKAMRCIELTEVV